MKLESRVLGTALFVNALLSGSMVAFGLRGVIAPEVSGQLANPELAATFIILGLMGSAPVYILGSICMLSRLSRTSLTTQTDMPLQSEKPLS